MEVYESPKIVRIGKDREKIGSVLRFTVRLSCPVCTEHYDFIFNARDAGIAYQYKADDIARAYIARCAPVHCPACISAANSI